MADANFSTVPEKDCCSINPNLAMTNAMRTLWRHAEIKDKKTLNELSNISEYAVMSLGNVVELTSGLASLVSDDEHTGCFQRKEDVSTLLYNITYQVEQIHAMLDLANMAKGELQMQEFLRKQEANHE